jgi:hypothetical protein
MAFSNAGILNATVGTGNGIGYSQSISSPTALALYAWYHVAFVKNGTTLTLYVNGVSVASATQTGTMTTGSQALIIGWEQGQPTTHYTDGGISDLRIVKGTALYTGNFTPPTAPLTPIANTSFLLGFSEYQFIDQSLNNFTITRNGDTTQSTFGPYGNNWSNYFDGTGDCLVTPADTAFQLGTGDFSVELWYYATTSATFARALFGIGNDASGAIQLMTKWPFGGQPDNRLLLNATGGPQVVTDTVFAVNSWNHIALSRASGTVSIYLNGTRVGNGSFTQNITANQLVIGRSHTAKDQEYVAGYISNFRLVKGTALYSGTTIPVPTAPLSSIPNTSLLTCQSNRFLDSSPNNFAITRNGDVSVQPYVPFPANWSNFFDGTGDYLSAPDSTAFAFGTGDFTIEYWIYAVSFLNAQTIFDTRSSSGVTGYSDYFGNTGSFNLFLNNTTIYTSASNVALNTWTHIAVSRSGTSIRVFINGTQSGSTVTNTTNLSDQKCLIGVNRNFVSHHNGYISNLRVLKGTAVYTSNFTPPTTPLTAIPNTSLLTCQSSSFTDFSPNNFTITVTGDVSARFYGPFSGPVPEPVVDVYTTTGVANTWIKRPGAKAVQMIAIGAGGGGGGGAASSNNLSRTGGGGGGGGANGQIIYTADQLPSTLYIRVGASGTGGTSTAAGGAGGNSTIAAADPITSSTSVYCMGGGGGGGKGGGDQLVTVGGGGGGTAGAGTTGTGSAAVAGGLPALGAGDLTGGGGGGGAAAETTLAGRAEWGGAGGGSTRQFGNTSLVGGSSLYGGGGGGQGGSMSSNQPSPSPFSATSGGNSGLYINSFSYAPPAGAAATTPANGGAGQGATTLYACGHGGGGGYANVSGGAGYTGGAGGFPGGGGGGGGASTVAGTGGVGGVGGAGRVVLITFF